jgi:hypothetical protein
MIGINALIPISSLNAIEDKKRDVEQTYICFSCQGILVDPVVCLDCFAKFCKKCTYKTGCVRCNSEKVSECSKEIKDFLSSLYIKCLYNSNGCKLEGKYAMVLKHIPKCSYKTKKHAPAVLISNSLNVSNTAYQNTLQAKSMMINESLNDSKDAGQTMVAPIKKVETFLDEKNDMLHEVLSSMQQKLSSLPYQQLLVKIDEKLDDIIKRIVVIESKLNIDKSEQYK